jgi:Ca-activated chloride channel family protein
MSNSEADLTLDRRLSDIPVPGGLVERLYGIAAWSDMELDVCLRNVPVPGGLLPRVQSIPDDEVLDEWVRTIPLPVSVIPRARNIALMRRRSLFGRLALAASLMLMVGVGYLASLAAVLVSIYPREDETIELVLIDQGPLHLVNPAGDVIVAPIVTPETETPPSSELASDAASIELLPIIDRVTPGPAGQLLAEIPHVWRPQDNWVLLKWGILGYTQRPEDWLPELTAIESLVPHGAEATLTRGFDREFLFSRRVHAPVLVSAEPSATSLAAPLSSSTTSFEQARRSVAEGAWPKPETIRVEDFLAAMDYRLPAAEPGDLAIRTAAGPSVFNPTAAGLLQVGVKAGGCPRRSLPATHLTIALDVSAAMNWDGRLDRARQAIRRVLPSLEPQDRLSLILLADEVLQVVQEARAEDGPRIADLLDSLVGRGGANLSAGLQQAVTASMQTESGTNLARRLVLITADQPSLSEASAAALRHTFEEAAKLDFQFRVLHVGEPYKLDDVWPHLVGSVSWSGQEVQSAEQMRWALVGMLLGASPLAATEVKMHVEFDPKAVAAYRLIGHEATGYGGLLPAAVESDLHVDEEVTVLFEVWLYPNDEDHVGQIRLEWTEPGTGQAKQAPPQRISRVQFSTSFEGAPISLQAAAICAETAEILRQSYSFAVMGPRAYRYQPKPRNLEEVRGFARRSNPALRARLEFQRLVALAEAAAQIPNPPHSAGVSSGVRGLVSGQWREIKE